MYASSTPTGRGYAPEKVSSALSVLKTLVFLLHD